MSEEQARELLSHLTYEQKVALLGFLETMNDEKERGKRECQERVA